MSIGRTELDLEAPELEQEHIDWQRYWKLFQYHRLWFVVPAFGIFLAVWSASWLLPATYRSETVILVEQQKVPNEYVVSNVADDLQQRLQSMTQQILSRTRLSGIIDQFGLYSRERAHLSDDEVVERMRKDIQIEMVRSPGRELSAFKIAYLSKSPQIAQSVTAQLSSLFISENLRVRQERSENTTEFLDSELERARQSLSAQELRVREFKSRYLGELPGQNQANVQILAGLQTRLQQEMDALAHAKQRKAYLESMLSQLRALEGGLRANPTASTATRVTLDEEIERLEIALRDLSSRYREEYPDVQKLRTQLENTRQLKNQRNARAAEAAKAPAEVEAVRSAGSYAELQAMSPRLNMESELKANRLEIENRERSIDDVEKQIESYQGRLNTTPLREQQLADLTRDYDQSRKNYEQLLAKRDLSSMATSLERRQQGEQFRIIDPPYLPQVPLYPKRRIWALFGLFVGVVCGLGFLIGRGVLHQVVYLREEVRRLVAAPILVEIPPLLTKDQERRHQRLVQLQTACFLLVAVLTTVCLGLSFVIG